MLLDVEMPELTGFDVIDALGELGDRPLPEIVFVTAFDHFAVQAFAISAVDYLLKPAAVRRHDSGRTFAVLAGGREVPVSRRYVARIATTLRFRKEARL